MICGWSPAAAINPTSSGPLPSGWPWQYLALYEAYSAELFTQAHRDAADTVWMHISEALDSIRTLVAEISRRKRRPEQDD